MPLHQQDDAGRKEQRGADARAHEKGDEEPVVVLRDARAHDGAVVVETLMNMGHVSVGAWLSFFQVSGGILQRVV